MTEEDERQKMEQEMKEGFSESEKLVYEKLNKNWLNVARCTPQEIKTCKGRKERRDLIKKIRQNVSISINTLNGLAEPGIPDFLAFNKKTYFFFEVKNGKDGIRKSQLDWRSKFKETNVAYILVENNAINNVYCIKEVDSLGERLKKLDKRLLQSILKEGDF